MSYKLLREKEVVREIYQVHKVFEFAVTAKPLSNTKMQTFLKPLTDVEAKFKIHHIQALNKNINQFYELYLNGKENKFAQL